MVYIDPPYGHGTFGAIDLSWISDLVHEAWRVSHGITYLHADPQLMWAAIATRSERPD